MAQRVWGVLSMVAGLAILAALALAGVDVYRAARTGPRWRRRLVGAGLVLMAALGLAPAGCESSAGDAGAAAATEGEADGEKATAGADLAATREWKHLAATWREAGEVISGKRGDYPFDEAGKKKILADLEAAGGDVAALEKATVLSAAEAGLLRSDLAVVVKDVQAKRPTELKMATCYKPLMVIPAADGMKRLKEEAPLLAQVAAAARVQPAVIEKVLVRIERDIATLGNEKELERMPEADRQAARETAAAAKAEVEKVRARLQAGGEAESAGGGGEKPAAETPKGAPGPAGAAGDAGSSAGGMIAKPNAAADLAQAPEWKRLAATWREAEEVAAGRRGLYPFNQAGRGDLLGRLAGVEEDIAALEAAHRLSAGEAGILRKDLPRLVLGVQEKRPTEMRMATCYEPMMWQPARESLKRLSERLAVLGQLAEAKAIHGEVVYKVLGSIEVDLAVLGSEKALAGLKEDERPEAVRVRDAAKAAVDKIRAKAGGTATQDLAESAGWKTIQAAWKVAEPLAESGKSTIAERRAADAALAKAEAAARDLALAGTISVAEAELVIARRKDLKADIYREPPTDIQVLCYEIGGLPPAKVSLERIRDRLPLLKQVLERGKVRLEVVARILPTIRNDLRVITDAKNLETLGKDEQGEAKYQVAPDAERTLKAIEALVGK